MAKTKPLKSRKSDARKTGSNDRPVQWALVGTLGLILAALAIIYLSSYFLPQVQFIENLRNGGVMAQPPRTGGFAVSEELGSYAAMRLVLSAVNIALVIYLLYVYLKDYLRYKSAFAFGIVAFLFSFLLYALSSLPLVHSLLGFRGLSSVFSFIPLLFSAVGLVIFAKLSNE